MAVWNPCVHQLMVRAIGRWKWMTSKLATRRMDVDLEDYQKVYPERRLQG
ncbi:hypothetical protein KC19_10G119500 [Ceratodon purpureus]|uniref:Uncharacterized protein n=1 Tax=Ceratodon purpureus TaxID=3225 RepID=A0A8T0GM28_CERPU|nr:hypothetical protein KC19_10G119500 [Ceratodon purpureus]